MIDRHFPFVLGGILFLLGAVCVVLAVTRKSVPAPLIEYVYVDVKAEKYPLLYLFILLMWLLIAFGGLVLMFLDLPNFFGS